VAQIARSCVVGHAQPEHIMSAYTEEFLVDKLNKLVNTQESIQSIFKVVTECVGVRNVCLLYRAAYAEEFLKAPQASEHNRTSRASFKLL
jgi:hypothetical protein